MRLLQQQIVIAMCFTYSIFCKLEFSSFFFNFFYFLWSVEEYHSWGMIVADTLSIVRWQQGEQTVAVVF